MNILFLYTELAEYTIACLGALKKQDSNLNILVIHYPVNPEAPFNFSFEDIGTFKSISIYPDNNSLLEEVRSFAPHKIIVSGWINKWYINICRAYRKKAVTVLTMDNHFKSTLKQKIFKVLFPYYLKRYFKYCWVPGAPQKQYALMLGFNEAQVFEGFYCCNQDKFESYFKEFISTKTVEFPKRFICVARYIPQKNYRILWKAFIKWQESNPNDWELWCAGTGKDFEKRITHPKIKHLGFVQANEWKDIIKSTGVFTLASLDEPWGVAVHEFSCAGFPLLISNKIGAASAFFNSNGKSFNPEIEKEIIEGFDYFNNLTQTELIQHSHTSFLNSRWITLDKWVKTVIDEFI